LILITPATFAGGCTGSITTSFSDSSSSSTSFSAAAVEGSSSSRTDYKRR
jgi:hypothetical protein